MLFDTVQEIVVSNKEANNYKNFDFDLITNFSVTSPISEEDFNNKDDSEIIEILYKNLSDYYERKKEINKELAFPVIKNVFENTPFELVLVNSNPAKHRTLRVGT